MTAMGFGGVDLGSRRRSSTNPIIDTVTSLFYISTKAETALLKKLKRRCRLQGAVPGPDGGGLGHGLRHGGGGNDRGDGRPPPDSTET